MPNRYRRDTENYTTLMKEIKDLNKWRESETNIILLYFNKKQGKEGGRKEGKKGKTMSVGLKTQHSMQKLSSFGTSLAV